MERLGDSYIHSHRSGALFASDPATFTVTAINDAPVVSDIPDQTVAEGSTFATVDLDALVTDVDDADASLVWSYAGNTALTVSIDVNRVATITIPGTDWNGSETVTFTATDPGALLILTRRLYSNSCQRRAACF